MSLKLRGLAGQSMAARKSPPDMLLSLVRAPVVVIGAASGSVTATKRCVAIIILWGAGGSGACGLGSSTMAGGGGGGAVYKRLRMSPGQSLSYVSPAAASGVADGNDGNNGGDATVTLPNGQVLKAGGGRGGAQSNAVGLGGVAQGGDINRPGTNGGVDTGPGFGLGGHAGDLSDLGADFSGAASNGGPGSIGSASVDAGPGRVTILLIAVH